MDRYGRHSPTITTTITCIAHRAVNLVVLPVRRVSRLSLNTKRSSQRNDVLGEWSNNLQLTQHAHEPLRRSFLDRSARKKTQIFNQFLVMFCQMFHNGTQSGSRIWPTGVAVTCHLCSQFSVVSVLKFQDIHNILADPRLGLGAISVTAADQPTEGSTRENWTKTPCSDFTNFFDSQFFFELSRTKNYPGTSMAIGPNPHNHRIYTHTGCHCWCW